MESVLALLCVVFFAVLTYGLIQGQNLTRNHLYNCRTIYIPEDINIEQVYQRIAGKSLLELQGLARRLGASKEYTDKYTSLDYPWLELKKFIILHSVSDEHIYLESLDETILEKDRDNARTRVTEEVHAMPTFGKSFLNDLGFYGETPPIPAIIDKFYGDTPPTPAIIDAMLEKMNFDNDIINQRIQKMKHDAGME